MKESGKRFLVYGITLVAAFIIWTVMIQSIDVQPLGVNGTDIGFTTVNCWFHKVTGVNMPVYVLTDWLGLVPIFVCILFGSIGLIQWIKRRSLCKVDYDLILLGIYYIIVIAGYLVFEVIPINYRPILIEGRMEASYPSSTTLLVLSVMPTLVFQVNRRLKNETDKRVIGIITMFFTVFMVIGRLICGVHWFTDIAGAVLLSIGLFWIYKGIVLMKVSKEK